MESALGGMLRDWNDQRQAQRRFAVQKCVEAALGHSLIPFTSDDLKYEVRLAIFGGTDMDIDQWYGVL